MAPDDHHVSKLRLEFMDVLRSRRTQVPVSVELSKPVKHPMVQMSPCPVINPAIFTCPRKNLENFEDQIREENFYLRTEAGEHGRVGVQILSLKETEGEKRPAIVFLHCTRRCKEWERPKLEAYASRGYVAVAIDARYHGEQATSLTTYDDALIKAWKTGETMPFLFDSIWDAIKLVDYLTQRDDIDPSRIGVTGDSSGGMNSWLVAALDPRYAVVVPVAGVQSFRWAIDNDKWQARVDSLKPLFEEARADLGKTEIDKDVVEKVWDRIAPGLASKFDALCTLPAIAPRPLLIVNGENDPRCPLAGLQVPFSRTREAYEAANCPQNFKVYVEPEIGHDLTVAMVKEVSDWFDKFL